MPNTLVHIACNVPLIRVAAGKIDSKWAYAGVVLPDLPWILQRLISAAQIVDPYALRSYCIIQTSFFWCVLASAAISAITPRPRIVFVILCVGSAMHLLLDTMQTKWANGVHWLAPLNWSLSRCDWFWPESTFVYLASIAGLGVAVATARKTVNTALALEFSTTKLSFCALFVAAYVLSPVLLLDKPANSDNHFLSVLIDRDSRSGRAIELDRVRFENNGSRFTVTTFAGEKIKLVKIPNGAPESGILSLRGVFVDPGEIKATGIHIHNPYFRDTATVIGLAIVVALFGLSFFAVGITVKRANKSIRY